MYKKYYYRNMCVGRRCRQGRLQTGLDVVDGQQDALHVLVHPLLLVLLPQHVSLATQKLKNFSKHEIELRLRFFCVMKYDQIKASHSMTILYNKHTFHACVFSDLTSLNVTTLTSSKSTSFCSFWALRSAASAWTSASRHLSIRHSFSNRPFFVSDSHSLRFTVIYVKSKIVAMITLSA